MMGFVPGSLAIGCLARFEGRWSANAVWDPKPQPVDLPALACAAGLRRGHSACVPGAGDAGRLRARRGAAAVDAGEGVQGARGAALVRGRDTLLVPERP